MGAVPTINHPNWKWSFADVEMSQLTDVLLFELYNVCYDCNNFTAGGRPGMEEIWDKILSRGTLMYGIATDDAHDYSGEFHPKRSNPGTGWIMVRAEELSPKAIVTAMEAGGGHRRAGASSTTGGSGSRPSRAIQSSSQTASSSVILANQSLQSVARSLRTPLLRCTPRDAARCMIAVTDSAG